MKYSRFCSDSHAFQLETTGDALLQYWRLADSPMSHMFCLHDAWNCRCGSHSSSAQKKLNRVGEPETIKIADFGCGYGEQMFLYSQICEFAKFTGFNIDVKQVDYANEHLDFGGDFFAFVADIENLSKFQYLYGTFDRVICSFTLGYVDVFKVMKSAFDLLVPNGDFCIYDVTSMTGAVSEDRGYRLYPLRTLAKAAKEAGFDARVSGAYAFTHSVNELDPKGVDLSDSFKKTTPRSLQEWIKRNTFPYAARFIKPGASDGCN